MNINIGYDPILLTLSVTSLQNKSINLGAPALGLQ